MFDNIGVVGVLSVFLVAGLINVIKGAVMQNKINSEQKKQVYACIICPRCGSEVKLGNKFCVSCGAPLEQPQDNNT